MQVLVAAGLIAALNGLCAFFANAWTSGSFVQAMINGFGINPIILLALFASAAIAFDGPEDEICRDRDAMVAVAAVGLALVPIAMAGSLGVLLVGAWLVASSRARSRGQRAGMILLALTTTLIWGRFVLMAVGEPLLALDGRFVAALAGTNASGNLVNFTVQGLPMAIGYACSSMHNMTMAILAWAAITQWFQIPLTWRSVLVCLAAMAANLGVNGARLATIAHHKGTFDYWHTGIGGSLFAWLGLATVLIIVVLGCHVLAPRRI